jgi:hypothetical protein
MSNAFAPIVRARPNPIFGRPVHQGSPPFDYSPILLLKPFGFRIAPDTLSSGIRRATGSRSVLAVSGFRLRARLDFSIPSCSPGQRGITPAFGYSAPHPSAEGTSTPMIHALPSAHYDPVRILIRVHVHRSAVAFMNRPGLPVRTRMRLPRFRAKNFSTCTRSPTARGSSHASHSPWDDVAFSSTEGDRHLGIRPVSQLNTWPVVSPVNASRRPSRDAAHHSGSGRMASPYPVGDFHLLFFASFPGALRSGSN